MTERELRRALRELPVPGEREAGERTLRVLRAAHAERVAAPPRRRGALRPALAVALALAALATAMTPAGAEVRRWIGDRFDPPASPTLSRLPAVGNLLVSSPRGSWVVHADGSLRRLGDYSSAGWSPRGLYVVAARERRLYAVEPDGTVRWSIVRPGAVSHPAWSLDDGFRVAYLEGSDLRVVIGNGDGDRRLARGVAPVTPSWRPGAGHVLTYATLDGRIVTRDVDGGEVLWSERVAERPMNVEWTKDGRRLVTLGPDAIRTYRRGGGAGVRGRLPAAGSAGVLAVHPSGRSAAVAGASGGVLAVSLDEAGPPTRKLFDGEGRF
ncbi:MAG TPA: hypothetical protein VFQ12_06015, partial [Thermoleophilaceae bacterium]|nr:hypothetical protein [Thermoleophilaceae bacterium]